MPFEPGLNQGDTLTNEEVRTLFQCSSQGGMRKSNSTNTLVLVSSPLGAIYADAWHGSILHYTGMGLTGDQVLHHAQNRTLAELPSNDVDAFLFEVFLPNQYTFQGRVELADEPYQSVQEDRSGALRNVWMFPLRIADGTAPYTPPERLLEDVEEARTRKAQGLDDATLKRRAQQSKGPPPKRPGGMTTTYQRSPYVAAYALRRAAGHCQLCGEPAPFKKRSGEPYLEVHHIIWLAQGGPDTIENTVALCPNCHRRMHVRKSRADLKKLQAGIDDSTPRLTKDIDHQNRHWRPTRR